ncbi:haloacid dehalogenase type II [Kineococcus rubinsiae]|uniref:haloacid dehalogenase type II n=1 Tax=Kineococcus rubinsiae TaxID=2609562 RepID=UPI0014320971|nr:haloacid dehalogenase type II [Kineococcus rubinsiae]NIZ91993.1 haloacid dehalogenase type II [Kineococcus rubinsiae]
MNPLSDVRLVLLDVNETLSDTAALGAALTALGASAHLAPTWFAAVLRDGFALLAAGTPAPFADVARAAALTVLHGVVDDAALPGAADRLVAALGELPPHPDVAPGLRALAGAGLRLATLSHGSPAVAEAVLARAGVREHVERVVGVFDEAGTWKPAAAAYRHALDVCGTTPEQTLLVAVHPWDLHGAAQVGLRTAWVDRAGAPWPAVCTAPDVVVSDLGRLPAALGR